MYDIVGPSVYLSGQPTEFDAMIIRNGSAPLSNSAEYENDDVKLILEIKKHGFYYKKIEGKYEIRNYFQSFRTL